jgi:hypothetical protein
MNNLHFIWTHLSFTLIAASIVIAVVAMIRSAVAKFQRPAIRVLTQDRVLADRSIFATTVIVASAISAALSLVRVGDVDMAGHLLAYSGELSFATIFFVAVMLGGMFASGGQRPDLGPWHGLQWVWTIGGLAVYAVALSGRGPDLYSLGYGSSLAWIGLAISACAAVTQRWIVASLSLGIVLAWQFRLTSAVNLWDYAIDPFLFVGATVQTSARVCGTCLRVGTKWGGGRKLVTETSVVVSKAA